MSRYKVILNTGEKINAPSDKARTRYEVIDDYGMNAVLERAKRTRAYKKAVAEDDASIRVIVCPNGDEVTQF